MIPADRSRACEWCNAPLTGGQLVACGGSHRLKRWRWLNGIPASPYSGVARPPDGSVLLDGHPDRPVPSERRSNGRYGGLQVSYRKAVEVLVSNPPFCSRACAERTLALALSDRQRERLERRAT